MGHIQKLPWRWKSWKFIILPFRLFFMYPPTEKNNDQYPTNSLCWTQWFQICLFKIRFSLLYIFAEFFFITKTSKYSTLKHWNQFCRKRHHSYGIRCPVFTPSQLSIAGLIMGHALFLPWLFLDLWGKSETLIFNKCACL